MTAQSATPWASAKSGAKPGLRRAALLVAVLAGLGTSGCDDSQNILVAVSGLPSGNVTLGAYYGLVDGQPGVTRAAAITQNLSQFGLKVPAGFSGKLALSVFAYEDLLPCIAASGATTVELAGTPRQDATVTLNPSPGGGCTLNKGPTELPPVGAVALAAWGNAADNIWVVGDKGMILRWDGHVFNTVKLPPELAGSPPTWRAVAGAGRDYVWIAGDKGAVARWNGRELTAVPLVNAVNMPFDPNSPQLPNWLSVSVASQASDDVFFAGHNNLIGHHYQTGINGVATFALTTSYRTYPPNATVLYPVNTTIAFTDVSCIASNECWFVGSDSATGGYILQAYSFKIDGNYIYTDYSNSSAIPYGPLTANRLRGIWTNFEVSTRELFAVGDNGTMLYSNNSLLGSSDPATIYPVFQSVCSSGCTPSAPNVNLNAIGGSGLSDLWIAGDSGMLFHFNPMATAPKNPLEPMPSATTSSLRRVFSTGGRVFLIGDQQPLASPVASAARVP
ncbi:MAG TPA: hypothetical protein PLW65_03350 [Pseudomonadota bacterium]|nr:hypothetical protein [Pseudomonadota bacterium]